MSKRQLHLTLRQYGEDLFPRRDAHILAKGVGMGAAVCTYMGLYLGQSHPSTLSRMFLGMPSKSKLGGLIQDRFAGIQQVGSGFRFPA